MRHLFPIPDIVRTIVGALVVAQRTTLSHAWPGGGTLMSPNPFPSSSQPASLSLALLAWRRRPRSAPTPHEALILQR